MTPHREKSTDLTPKGGPEPVMDPATSQQTFAGVVIPGAAGSIRQPSTTSKRLQPGLWGNRDTVPPLVHGLVGTLALWGKLATTAAT
jgi:hypothetical protein